MDIIHNEYPVLIIGNGKLACSIAVCLLSAGHRVTLVTDNRKEAVEGIQHHFLDISRVGAGKPMT
ncbi:MAG: 2-dehydropantoate 2-reductase N-terminal domain-containing protein, partial [Chitinophaga rupis]